MIVIIIIIPNIIIMVIGFLLSLSICQGQVPMGSVAVGSDYIAHPHETSLLI